MKTRRAFPTLLLSLLAAVVLASPAFAEAEKGMQSQAFDLAAYRGRVVYLDFWASWCGPCRASFPFMNELAAKYGKDLQVVTVNLDENRADAEEFIDEFQPEFPVFHDPAGQLATRYGVAGMPNSFLFDRQGELILKHVGFTKKDPVMLEDKISQAIAR